MMNKSREFDNILDECLERILTKGESTELCLGRYPEHAAELEPLLQTALDTREATAIKARPEFRERAGYEFQAALRETESKKSRGLFGWQPRWATALIVVIVLLLAGSGTVAAAGNSLPDEPLYQVKLATEAVWLVLTPEDGKAELCVRLTDRRLAEMVAIVETGSVADMERAAVKLDDYLMVLADLNAPTGDAAERFMAAEPAPTAPAELEAPTAPTEPTPPQEPAEPSAPQAPTEPATPMAPTEPSAPQAPAEPSAPLPVPEEDMAIMAEEPMEIPGVGEESWQALASRNAAENIETLQVALEEAPESVKPVLLRAIMTASDVYGEAIWSRR